VGVRRRIELGEVARADMADLKAKQRRIYAQVQQFFKDLEKSGELGYALRDEFEGFRAAHICNDRYRVVWRDQPEIEDYTGREGDTVIPVEVVLVGPKNTSSGTIYERGNPAEMEPSRRDESPAPQPARRASRAGRRAGRGGPDRGHPSPGQGQGE
jgi:hypothetical protein